MNPELAENLSLKELAAFLDTGADAGILTLEQITVIQEVVSEYADYILGNYSSEPL